MRLLRSACFAVFAAVLVGCSRDDPPPPEPWRLALDSIPGATFILRSRLPADSVVARRGGVTIIFSAAEVGRYLSRFRRYPYAADASALRERVRGAVRDEGWAALAEELPGERAVLEFGSSRISLQRMIGRAPAGRSVAPQVRILLHDERVGAGGAEGRQRG